MAAKNKMCVKKQLLELDWKKSSIILSPVSPDKKIDYKYYDIFYNFKI